MERSLTETLLKQVYSNCTKTALKVRCNEKPQAFFIPLPPSNFHVFEKAQLKTS